MSRGRLKSCSGPEGLHPVVAVCRMAPQAALLEQRIAVGHRHPAGSTTRARRAWSPSVRAGILQETTRGQWPAATTLKFIGLVKVANADPRGDFLLFDAKRASRDYRGGLLCQRLGLDGIRGLFVSYPGLFSIQSCDNRGQPLQPLCGPFTRG